MSNSKAVQEEREVLGFSEQELCESYFIIIKFDFLKTVWGGRSWPNLVFHSHSSSSCLAQRLICWILTQLTSFFLIFSGKGKLFCALQSVLKHPCPLATGYQQHFPYHGIKNGFRHFQVSSGMGGLNGTWWRTTHQHFSGKVHSFPQQVTRCISQTSVSYWYHTEYSCLTQSIAE